MLIKDPFVIGPAKPLTEEQKADKKFDEEWEAAGKPTLEERIETRNQTIAQNLKRAFEEK
jgi:hypothetical protein